MAGSFDDPDLAVEDYIPKDKAATIPNPSSSPHADMQLMRERWSKLLLGEDPSGGAKGCGPALAMANAITSVSDEDELSCSECYNPWRVREWRQSWWPPPPSPSPPLSTAAVAVSTPESRDVAGGGAA
ncbi:unnamed protein product [Closterium sp. Naga37s-1]|nr:unnamed protein product [Closterium sp. Naga37s-1]